MRGDLSYLGRQVEGAAAEGLLQQGRACGSGGTRAQHRRQSPQTVPERDARARPYHHTYAQV